MYKLKLIKKNKTFKIKMSNRFSNVVLGKMQEKEVTPTKEIQEIKADQQYDGLSKVIVKAIPDEYIIPNGDINITENGTYDVTNKVNAIVNIPEKKLGSKTITTNGTYKASDDNLDGYSEVDVQTSGVDINDYITYENFNNVSLVYGRLQATIKKVSGLTMPGNTTSYTFSGCENLETIENLTIIPESDGGFRTQSMFYKCKKLSVIPNEIYKYKLKDNITYMFSDCVNLETINELNCELAGFCGSAFTNCKKLKNFGGMLNIGNNWDTIRAENFYNYVQRYTECTELTHESLMNIINKLYDIKTKGVKAQTLQLGATNIAKLTADEIAIATNKGFNVN